MDDTFWLTFALPGVTPSAEAFAGTGAHACGSLRQALVAAQDHADEINFPFIAHRHFVFEPYTIRLLYEQFVAAP